METGQVVHIVLDQHPLTAGNVETQRYAKPIKNNPHIVSARNGVLGSGGVLLVYFALGSPYRSRSTPSHSRQRRDTNTGCTDQA
jgi:hypothetical protein